MGNNILSSPLCFLVMRETLECSSSSADWIVAVVTVGSKLWELGGALPCSAVTKHEGRWPPSAAIPHAFKSGEGPVALWKMSCMMYLYLHFQRAGGGVGPFQLVYAKQDKINKVTTHPSYVMEKCQTGAGFKSPTGGLFTPHLPACELHAWGPCGSRRIISSFNLHLPTLDSVQKS